tara:strand:+ start:207 stop:899 length:693 start_codon:yes stop_codon:yes gene_type:complete
MNPIYAVMKGTAMKDKRKRAGGGGGGTASVSVATSASGNYDNMVEILLENGALAPQDVNNYSGGILGFSQSVLGTATSPTRTTQTISVSAATYLNSNNANGTSRSNLHIGGYIRSNNFTTANKQSWSVASNTIQSQSFATGVTVVALDTDKSRANFRDNTFGSSNLGIYNQQQHHSGTHGFHGIQIVHAAGRGAATLPQVGDTFTFRIEVEDQDISTTYTAIHEVIVNFV